MNLPQKIAYNTIISVVARVIGVTLALVTVGFLTRALGKEGYGEYATILAFLYLFNALADLGLYSFGIREISRPGADERKIISNIFTLRLTTLIIFLGIAPLVALFFPYSSSIKIGIGIAAISFLFLSSSQVLLGIFQKHLRIVKPAIAELTGRTVQLGLIFFFFKLNLGLFYFLGALIISSLIIFILNFFFARKFISFSLAFDFSYWKEIIKTTLPIAVSLFLTLVYFKIDVIFLSIIKTSEAVGIYNLGYKVLESLIFFPTMFVGLMMPLLSYSAVSDVEKFKKIFQKTFNILLSGAVPLMIGGFFLSSAIVILLGGQEFILSTLPLQILLVATAMIFLGTLGGNGIIALNQQRKAVWIYLGGAILNIILNLIFIPKFSYNGAALTTVLTEILVTFFLFWIISKNLNWSPSFKIFPKTIVATFCMAIPLWFFANPFQPPVGIGMLFLLLFLSAIIYSGVLYLTGGISKEEIKDLVK